MNKTDIIISRGLVKCKQLGGAYEECVKYLYVALSPTARDGLKGVLTDKEVSDLEKFLSEEYKKLEDEGYEVEPDARKGKQERS